MRIVFLYISLAYLCFPAANWKSRAEIIDYCIRVVDRQLEQKESNLRQVIDDGTPTTQPALFKPESVDVKPWQGPTKEFYRPAAQDRGKLPQEGELDSQQQYELERRQRERENDARSALWEERVKVSISQVLISMKANY